MIQCCFCQLVMFYFYKIKKFLLLERYKSINMIKPSWNTAKIYEDITYKKSNGVARIAFNRPDVRNAFRPKTTS